MKIVPAAMTETWKSEDKTGANRPVVRATVQSVQLLYTDYDTELANGFDLERDRNTRGTFTSIIFGDASPADELRGIKSISWNRSVEQDVATCTLTLSNTEYIPIGSDEDDEAGEFERPGFFSPMRGETTISQNRWGYDSDEGWNGRIVPDRLVRTYEGYGFDAGVTPFDDPNLIQSGTWLIDRVTLTDEGEIRLEMRDVGRLLLDQIVFPPVVPYAEYPLTWSKIRSAQVPARDVTGGTWAPAKGKAKSSNALYIGQGISDNPSPYVSPNGGVHGHLAAHALEQNDKAYWLSTSQESPGSHVWWQVDLDDHTTNLNGVRIRPFGGPYRVYISLQRPDGSWIGRKKIPYKVTTEDIDLNADIPFVHSYRAERGGIYDITLKRKYGPVKAVRLTFSRLQDFHLGKYQWRAGLGYVGLYTAPTLGALGFAPGTVTRPVGNYQDYTDIVKWVTAWAGWYWPQPSSDENFIQAGVDEASARRFFNYSAGDVKLPKGRVWGDFENSGTAGVADLTIEQFDKKPLMDVINYVRDVLGFNFFIDETGGIVWRLPNLFKLGNYISPGHRVSRGRSRTTNIVTIDERTTMLSYSTTMDSANVRERIFVGNNTGKLGIVIKGFVPYYTRFRRVAGWTDQHFETKREVRVMADMLAARAMFTYKRGKVVTPGYPAIQIDDQIRLFERITNETYYHYVMGVTSDLNMESGEWTYTLDTHWLGERPSDAWVVRVDQLDTVTQQYLNLVGGES